MTDFNTPTNTSSYSGVLSTLNSKITSVAKALFTSDTNIPTGTLQYNRTNRVFEEWNGTSWVEQRTEPAGVIKAHAGSTAPRGHLLCDGSAVSRTTYADLFAAIGTAYGAGNGTSTFNLPNLKGRFPLGKSDAGTGSSLAATGGAIDHTHTTPAHYHGMGTGADLNITSSGSGTTGPSATGISINSTNTDHTHSGTTNTDGAHVHTAARGRDASFTGGTYDNIGFEGGGAANGTTKTCDIKTTGSSHSHAFTTGTQNSNTSHTHGVTDPTHTHTTPAHTHAAGNIAGRIGLVTGGVDGNAAMTSGANNPPFQVVNYIITV